VFLLTVTYLFTVLPATGWDIAMFDAPGELLPWLDGNRGAFQLLWALYFVSQAFLLPVPFLVYARLGNRAVAVLGTAAVLLAMAGLVVVFASGPAVAAGYREAVDSVAPQAQQSALVVHDALADVGKDLRLFSELLLGGWLVGVGRMLTRTSGDRVWWALVAVGGWCLVVAALKLGDPGIALEDWLGFVLGLAYLGLGIGLLRLRPAGAV
jgi:hypothetical protein